MDCRNDNVGEVSEETSIQSDVNVTGVCGAPDVSCRTCEALPPVVISSEVISTK